MEKGLIYKNVECVDFSTDFDGICFIDKKKVFVENFLQGEVADIEIIEVKSKFIRGKVVNLTSASPMRKNALAEAYPNAYFGGCDLQMINYPAQLETKKVMTEKIARLQARGGTFVFEDIKPSDKEIHYRNRSHYHLYFDEQTHQIKASFFEKGTKNIKDIDVNLLASEAIADMLPVVLDVLNANNITIDSMKQGVQGLKTLMFRYAEKTAEMMIIFISSTKEVANIEQVAQQLMAESAVIKSVILNINTKNKGAVLGKNTFLLAGKTAIKDQLLGLNFDISPTAFYQVNETQTENIYQEVIKLLKDDKKATLLDFYCGIGTMSLLLAEQIEKVVGIDISKDAIESAKQNAKQNGIKNATFLAQDVDDFMENYDNKNTETVAIIDPPRTGCTTEFIYKLCNIDPTKIVYVSCNPKTLVRDLQKFSELGYKYSNIKLYDMFPQSLHVEAVVLLSREK